MMGDDTEWVDSSDVRCPDCGHVQRASKEDVDHIVEVGVAHSTRSGGDYHEVCGECGGAYRVGVEVEVTLTSPPREGGDRG